MPKMKKAFSIGLTGGIATGKTTVLKEFARRGLPTISSDVLSHECLRPGHPCYRRIVKHFGKGILASDRKIDRLHLGSIVFTDARERKWLERVIHPHVIRALQAFVRKHRGPVVLDIPLLFEGKLQRLVDTTLLVTSSLNAQLDRIRKRDGLPRKMALQRIRAQMPLNQKRKIADYVIPNQGRQSELQNAVGRYLKHLGRNA